jgi:hypothetical protein
MAQKGRRRFGDHFDLERLAGQTNYSQWPPGYAAYLMIRKERGVP